MFLLSDFVCCLFISSVPRNEVSRILPSNDIVAGRLFPGPKWDSRELNDAPFRASMAFFRLRKLYDLDVFRSGPRKINRVAGPRINGAIRLPNPASAPGRPDVSRSPISILRSGISISAILFFFLFSQFYNLIVRTVYNFVNLVAY